jgi:hypothetical protein
MNYLEVVNSVLRRMRQSEVSSLYENKQSAVIAEFVNDAKREVEDAHDWSAYRTDLNIVTAAGVNTYDINGSQNRATVIDVRDITNSAMLSRVSNEYIRRQDLVSSPGTTRPSYWALQGVGTDGDTQIKFWPTPDAIYNLKVHCVLRPDELVAEGDEITIPSKPVVLLTWALASQERGDVDAGDLQSLFQLAKNALADAVMYDVAKNPEEQIWYPV